MFVGDFHYFDVFVPCPGQHCPSRDVECHVKSEERGLNVQLKLTVFKPLGIFGYFVCMVSVHIYKLTVDVDYSVI